MTPVVIPLPLPPEKPNVTFVDKGDGIWLSYDDGRKLALYLVQMNGYQEELDRIIKYYVAVSDVEKNP